MATTTLTPTSATAETTPKLVKKASTTTELKGPTSPLHTSFGCQHIKSLLQAAREQATTQYTRVIQSLSKDGHVTGRIYKSGDKANVAGGVTYLCLQCPNVSTGRERHRKDHGFSVESNNGFIYCHDCRDFVYDPTFEAIRSTHGQQRKRKAQHLYVDGDKRLISTNTTATPCAATGLRGLYNMGQTCFMSVILQALIHNPLIRSFYLSEGHVKDSCEREACTSCALDDIFTDFFGQEKHEGYGAVHMLQGCWKNGGGLAGYSQQDAHEYLGFILNSLHAANTAEEEGAESGNSNENPEGDFVSKDNCTCIVHQTFGGQLRSTVTCSACNNTTTAVDPFMDLSLDIRHTAPASAKKAKLKLLNGSTTTSKDTSTSASAAAPPIDLTECLDRFTSTETLSADSYTCRKCSSPQTADKKLNLLRLPPVVPIHLKRFSHSKSTAQSSKVETKIRFPLSLDLSPYTASSSSKSKKQAAEAKDEAPNGGKAGAEVEGEREGRVRPVYELSSVIVHKGKMDNGHYVSFARQGEEWFRFDDSMVVQVEERDVLAAEAYMLFYVARDLAAGDS